MEKEMAHKAFEIIKIYTVRIRGVNGQVAMPRWSGKRVDNISRWNVRINNVQGSLRNDSRTIFIHQHTSIGSDLWNIKHKTIF